MMLNGRDIKKKDELYYLAFKKHATGAADTHI